VALVAVADAVPRCVPPWSTIVYPVMGLPLLAGAVQDTFADLGCVTVAVTLPGALGGPWHTPFVHVPVVHAVQVEPQWFESVCVFQHPLAQAVYPERQVYPHEPPLHDGCAFATVVVQVRQVGPQ
jgi:hypothetical protein